MSFPVTDRIDLLEALVVEFRRAVEATGARFAVFSEGPENYFRENPNPHEVMKNICANNNISFVKGRPAYQRFAKNHHPNALGNKQIAQDLARYIKKTEILD